MIEQKKTRAIKEARDLFDSGFNCAEATFIALGTYLGLDVSKQSPIATCFGGGIGRSDLICGAVSGALMGIGMFLNRVEPSDKEGKERAYAISHEFIDGFSSVKGSLYCSKLCECNLSTPDGFKKFQEEDRHTITCIKLVEYATEYACDLVHRYTQN